MLYPTIDELTEQGKYNRYELALATAKCARLITDEYVSQREYAEKAQTGNKEADRALASIIDRELRDEKAVKVAINRMHNGQFEIDLDAADYTTLLRPVTPPPMPIRDEDDDEDEFEDEEDEFEDEAFDEDIEEASDEEGSNED